MFTRFRAGRVLSRPVRLVGALAAVVGLVGLSAVIPPSSSAPVARAADDVAGPVTLSKTLVDGKGKKYPSAKVTVSQTKNILQRQVVRVSWQGFEPSRNYRINQLDLRDYYSEFPVVIVQCWGRDTAEKPMDPTHCQQIPSNSQVQPGVYDSANDPAFPNPTDVDPEHTSLGFTAVDGTHYPPRSLPDSLNGNVALPNNTRVTFSDKSGGRSNIEFEIRGGGDIPPLGCSAQQACTLEVVPILRPYCKPGHVWFSYCVEDRKNAPAPGAKQANDWWLTENWWLGTQWKNRFGFEFSMAPLPGECAVVDQRPTLTVKGSEAPAPMMESWQQRFCTDPNSTFKLSHSARLPEDLARRYLTTKNGSLTYGADGIFTSFPVTGSPRPLVHAPVGVTGWTVAYKIDDHDNNEYMNLTFSPLLLAKLITSSYAGAPKDAEPVLAGNPSSLFNDPEFKALNPNFTPYGAGDGGAVIWDQFPSDVFAAMFAYIDADPEARAWLDGKPDAYSGMVINPEFRGKLTPPQTTVQYFDGWVRPKPGPNDHRDVSPCELNDPKPQYGIERALTAISLEDTAKAVLNRTSPGLGCDYATKQWVKGTGFQSMGARSLIAFTTVPLAERYGLALAKLRSPVPNAKAVAPSGWENLTGDLFRYNTLAPALGYMKQDEATGVVSPDFKIFPYNNAYPGVLPVYAAIPTCGLTPELAGQYADFLTFAAGAGQTPGMGGGQLPYGYTPLPKAYAEYTLTAAKAVRDQKCVVPPPPPDLSQGVRTDEGLPAPGSVGADGSGFGSGTGAGGSAGAAGGSRPSGGSGAPGAGSSVPGAGSAPSSAASWVAVAGKTGGLDSWLATWGLIIVLVVGLALGLAAPVVRIAGEPGHPVRRFFADLGHRLAATFRRRST